MNRTLIAVVFISIVFCSCDMKPYEASGISSDIILMFDTSKIEKTAFRITDTRIQDTGFDEYIFITPYTRIDVIERSIDVNLDLLYETGIEDIDHFTVLGLIKQKKVYNYYYLARQFTDYTTIKGYVLNKDAKLVVYKRYDMYVIDMPVEQ